MKQMRNWLCKSVYIALVVGFILVQLATGGRSIWGVVLLCAAQLWRAVCTLLGWNPEMDGNSQWYRNVYGWSDIVFLAAVSLIILVPIDMDWRVRLWLLGGAVIVMAVLLIWAERKEKGRK